MVSSVVMLTEQLDDYEKRSFIFCRAQYPPIISDYWIFLSATTFAGGEWVRKLLSSDVSITKWFSK